MDSCRLSGTGTVLTASNLIHATALFAFLVVFYTQYASKIESKESTDKFVELATDKVQERLREADKDGSLRKNIQATDAVWAQLEKAYSKPDRTRETYNQWLFRTSYLVLTFMIIVTLFFFVVIKLSCAQCPRSFLWMVLGEVVITFALVGIVEYMFFTNVALKMIPAPPSLMVNKIIGKLKSFGK